MKNILYYIFGFFILSSCSPSQDENGDFLQGVEYGTGTNTGGGNGGSTTTRFLSKVSGIDSDGERTTVDYIYTGSKLTSVKSQFDDGNENAVLTYNSNNQIIHMDITNVESGDTRLTKLDLVYDSGKLKSVSGTTESGGTLLYKSTTDVTYSGEKVTKVLTKMNAEDPDNPGQFILEYEVTSNLTYAGNNISNWKLATTSASGGPITIPPIVIESALSNYDTNKNPFASLPLAYNILSTHYNTSNQGMLGLSANNYKTVKVTTMGMSQSLTMTYQYNSDSYPTEMTSNAGDKLNFLYK
ncbi:hypothetical protein [Epilithonimonas arachidiradicis]|uniref:DUF4595 domain-containing protein n=1 Tax=Epilithonimonas arachidiradicis TaxID=1617282 RepID=A0A420DDG8_9FLAO|nr:hypothetical protein [Epilithonimonas arachidiradicis]RKE89836.1 hypothetical protein BXY58_0415 [Epilithonimonas arachidiradicis]GGG45669.1 hypothetical protein GCM10007332_03950 [Epilithonimonas arachidiradicis]